MITQIIAYLNSVNIKVPEILKEQKISKNTQSHEQINRNNTKLSSMSNFYENNVIKINKIQNLISIDKIEYIFSWVESKITKTLFLYYKNNKMSLSDKTNLLNVDILKKFYVPINYSTEAILKLVRENNINFYNVLLKSINLGLWDLKKYGEKTDEGQAIYIPELDSTFISLSSENNITDYFYLAHEVGHAYYNFINHKYRFDQIDIVRTEYEAYRFEVYAIEKFPLYNVYKEYIYQFLLEIDLISCYFYFMILTYQTKSTKKEEIVKNYIKAIHRFIPWLCDAKTISVKEISTGLVSQIEDNTFEDRNIYYLLARLKVLENKEDFFSRIDIDFKIDKYLFEILEIV